MELADDGRIGDGYGPERTAPEDELDVAARLPAGGLEALLDHLALERVQRIACRGSPSAVTAAGLASHLLSRLAAAYGLRQEKGEALIGTGGPPGPSSTGMGSVAKARSTWPIPGLDLFDDEPGLPQLGQMLAHGVVVKVEHLGELGHVHRPWSLEHIEEDLVSSWVTQGPRLHLNRRCCHLGGRFVCYPTSIPGRIPKVSGRRQRPPDRDLERIEQDKGKSRGGGGCRSPGSDTGRPAQRRITTS